MRARYFLEVLNDADPTRVATLERLVALDLLPQGGASAQEPAGMNWTLIMATRTDKFVTSDNPALLLAAPARPLVDRVLAGLPPSLPAAELTLALSPDRALLLSRTTPEEVLLLQSSQLVRRVNQRTIEAAEEDVYASFHDEHLLAYVQAHIGRAPLFFRDS